MLGRSSVGRALAWHMQSPGLVPALQSRRQEEQKLAWLHSEFKTSLDCMGPCLKDERARTHTHRHGGSWPYPELGSLRQEDCYEFQSVMHRNFWDNLGLKNKTPFLNCNINNNINKLKRDSE